MIVVLCVWWDGVVVDSVGMGKYEGDVRLCGCCCDGSGVVVDSVWWGIEAM